MRRGHLASGAAVFAAAALLIHPEAHAQSCAPDMRGVQHAESARYVVAYRFQPEKPEVSAHFAIDLVVCPKRGSPSAEAVRVDARMPAHGHGMNYVAKVKVLGDGRYRADGLMFHMPGRWELVFDVTAGAVSERVTQGVELR
jgi:hypothetical protein